MDTAAKGGSYGHNLIFGLLSAQSTLAITGEVVTWTLSSGVPGLLQCTKDDVLLKLKILGLTDFSVKIP